MDPVTVQYATTHLSPLLASVELGQEVVIARGERPIARLVRMAEGTDRELGYVAYSVPDDFGAPLPDEELDAWEDGL